MSELLATRLRLPLLILRVTLGIFLLQWGVEKIIQPETTRQIYSYFYMIDLPLNISPFLGVVQALLAVAIIIGFQKKYVYLIGFVLHGISTVSTWQQLITPYAPNHHLFMTGVPVLAAFWLLYRVRDWDVLCAFDDRRK